jgi:hypothetical protein
MDANVCVVHALDLGTHAKTRVQDFDCGPVRCLVDGCQRNKIRIGTYQKTKAHTYNCLAERIDELAQKCHLKNYWYAMSSLFKIGEKNLNKLFGILEIFPDKWSQEELATATKFFGEHGNDVGTFTDPDKQKVPEPHDLEFLVSSHNLWPGTTHIVSDDGHFVGNAQEIPTWGYRVEIIPMDKLNELEIFWHWT